MNLKQLRKYIRFQKGTTIVLIEQDGKKLQLDKVSYSLSNDGTCYLVLHPVSDKDDTK